jgi:hypothetical protein
MCIGRLESTYAICNARVPSIRARSYLVMNGVVTRSVEAIGSLLSVSCINSVRSPSSSCKGGMFCDIDNMISSQPVDPSQDRQSDLHQQTHRRHHWKTIILINVRYYSLIIPIIFFVVGHVVFFFSLTHKKTIVLCSKQDATVMITEFVSRHNIFQINMKRTLTKNYDFFGNSEQR